MLTNKNNKGNCYHFYNHHRPYLSLFGAHHTSQIPPQRPGWPERNIRSQGNQGGRSRWWRRAEGRRENLGRCDSHQTATTSAHHPHATQWWQQMRRCNVHQRATQGQQWDQRDHSAPASDEPTRHPTQNSPKDHPRYPIYQQGPWATPAGGGPPKERTHTHTRFI